MLPRGTEWNSYSESRGLGVSKIVPLFAKEQWLKFDGSKDIDKKHKDGKGLPMRPPNSAISAEYQQLKNLLI